MMEILTAGRLRSGMLFLISLLIVGQASAQTADEPLREELLNGLRILIWPRPRSPELTLKLRLHSGAAFDLAGKSGGMSLLGDVLFPDPATLEFFTDEMGGKLDVDTDLDSVTITMNGKASEFERIIEILRNALVSTQITPEIVARQRDRRLKLVKAVSVSPATVADRAIASRLFENYPYGRPAAGSAEDLARIERADLMLARDRFLNANNAILAIVGGVEKNRAMRALRQLLGSWRQSEHIVPTTFRRAAPPDLRTLIINGPGDQTADVRLAVRGFARSDPDENAANILALVTRQRWLSLTPEFGVKPFFVRHEAHQLPGMFVMGAAINSKSTGQVITTARKVLESLLKSPVTTAELAQARNEVIVEWSNRLAKPETMIDPWLDIDTFRLPPVAQQLQGLRNVSVADLQRVASRLFQEAPIASIVLGDAQQLKAELDGHVAIEVIGEIPKANPNQPVNPAPRPNIQP